VGHQIRWFDLERIGETTHRVEASAATRLEPLMMRRSTLTAAELALQHGACNRQY
jgi:hypothetical protein